MDLIGWSCLFISGITLLVLVTCIFLLKADAPAPLLPDQDSLPKVAVLVAARDEESSLTSCIAHLLQQAYPQQQLKIYIGDDDSTDGTLVIARNFQQKHPDQIKVLSIQKKLGKAKGKANVLAQLARAAEGWADYFCITDADVQVPPHWVSSLLSYQNKHTGTLSAATVLSADTRWSYLQRIDWLLALAMAKAYTYFPKVGKVVTAIGNNMLIPVPVYQATGGYEEIPFSITEDFALLQKTEKIGFTSRFIALPETCAQSLPAANILRLLHQRKRWMSGALGLPRPLVALLFVQAFFYPAILVALWWLGWPVVFLWLVKVTLQTLLVNKFARQLSTRQMPAGMALLHELYSFLLSSCLVVFYLLPVPISWKGRRYKDNTYEIR